MKKIFYILFLFLFLLINSSFVFAAPSIASDSMKLNSPGVQKQTSTTGAQVKDKVLENLRQNATKHIDARIEYLNNLLSRINSDKKLTSADKSSLTADINNEINRLNTLKNAITQDSDATAVRSDFKQVLAEKIYLYFAQKSHLLIIINNLLYQEQRLEDLYSRLNSLLNDLNNKGTDTKQLQNLLTDMNTNLSQIKLTLETDKSKLTSTTTSSFKDVFSSTKTDLAATRQAFAKIREDIAQMRKYFNTLNPAVAPLNNNSTTNSGNLNTHTTSESAH